MTKETSANLYKFYCDFFQDGDIANGEAIQDGIFDNDEARMTAAIASDKVDAFKIIMQRNRRSFNLEYIDNDREQNFLTLACYYGAKEVVAEILEMMKQQKRFEDVKSYDSAKRTPLIYTAKYGHIEVAKQLLDFIKNELKNTDSVYHRDLENKDAMAYALENNHSEVFALISDVSPQSITQTSSENTAQFAENKFKKQKVS